MHENAKENKILYVITYVTHGDVVGSLHDVVVEEQVRHHFVHWRQFHHSGVRTMDHGDAERVDVHELVHVEPSPDSGVVEHVERFGTVQNTEKHHSLVTHFSVHHGKHLSTR